MNIAILEKRLANPGIFEKQYFAFWKALKVKVLQQKTLAEQTRYDSHFLNSGSVTNFFKGTPDQRDTNMGSSFTSAASEHMLVTGIRIWEGVNAVISDTDWTAGASEAAVKNAKMSILNNGTKVLDDVPLSDFLDDLTTRDDGFYDLNEPIAWEGQTDLIVSIELTDTGIIPVSTNLRVGLRGLAYIS